jgi:hypothetical protein
MTKESMASAADIAVRAGGLLVAAAYVFGFLVVTTHHAQFGISDFTLLRPKILTAGTCFLAVTLFAVFTGLRTFGLAGLSGVGLPVDAKPARERETVYMIRVFVLWSMSLAVALFVGPLLFQDGPWQPWLRLREYAAVAVCGGAAQVCEHLPRIPRKYRILLIVSLQLGLAAFAWRFFAESVFWLGLWMGLVSWTSAAFGAWFQNTEKLARIVQIESILMLVGSGLLVFYSLTLYGRIQPWLGGGAPLRVDFALRDSVPFINGHDVQASLLEETEHGFYIVHEGGRAVFIPRDVVRSVRYRPSSSTR